MATKAVIARRKAKHGKHYEGGPCKHGHTLRYTCNGHCVLCAAVAAKWNRSVRRDEAKMFRDIPNHCELCGLYMPQEKLKLDHCHKTNKPRGWICSRCNTGLGYFGDKAAGVQKAFYYLLKFEESV